MEDLELDDLLKIYLGELSFMNLEITLSKSLAYDEIVRRTNKYRTENHVNEIVKELERIDYILNTKVLDSISDQSIYFINQYFIENELHELIKQSVHTFHPNSALLDRYNLLTERLELIMLNDPEKLRHDSKFKEGSYYETYYSSKSSSRIYTKDFQFEYQVSAYLGDDYFISIFNESKKHNICIYLFDLSSGSFGNMNLLYNFLLYYNLYKSEKQLLWLLFFEENESFSNFIIEDIRRYILNVLLENKINVGLVPFTILNRNKKSGINYRIILEELNTYYNNYNLQNDKKHIVINNLNFI